MANKYLARGDAPFDAKIWKELDQAMVRAAKSQMVGRRLLPVEGPFGFGLKGISLPDQETQNGWIIGRMQPVVVIREPFTLGVRDLASYEQEGITMNMRPIRAAARECARMEDELIFNGGPEVPGLLTVSGANTLQLLDWDEVGTAAGAIMQGITALDKAGFHGPYALALTPERYNLLFRRYPQGNQSEMDHIAKMVTDGIFKAPVLDAGGVLVSGGMESASLVLGQDMSIGFVGPAGDELEFYISESITLRIRYPGAICVLQE
jgi:uncharacterized linocin/CFP29 family protein